jgi:hypothetical protein
MRVVSVEPPSFPEVAPNAPIPLPEDRTRWRVLCGDADHWRVGVYSPAATRADQLTELERHTCPELFWLLEGRLTLLLAGPDGLRELPLEPGHPVLVTAPHDGFCPDGPHTGRALVVERDTFATEYRVPRGWLDTGREAG